MSKTILVLPIFFIFGLFAHGLPLYVVQDAPVESLGAELLLYALLMFVFESVAECLSVWIAEPIFGMLLVRILLCSAADAFCVCWIVARKKMHLTRLCFLHLTLPPNSL